MPPRRQPEKSGERKLNGEGLRSVRTTISLPNDLYQRAKRADLNVSAICQEGVRAALGMKIIDKTNAPKDQAIVDLKVAISRMRSVMALIEDEEI